MRRSVLVLASPERHGQRVAGIGIPLRGASWPVADPTLPLYREDLDFILGYRCSAKIAGAEQLSRLGR